MKALLILILLFLTRIAAAQMAETPLFIKKNRLEPDSTLNISSLARYFNSNYSQPQEKLQAIYEWVISNIRYSSDSVHNLNTYADPLSKINFTLRRKQGVCENVAAIFSSVSNECGIRSVQVAGYTRQGGVIDRAGHSWVASFVNGQWLLSDPTWDIGKLQPDHFLISPSSFIYSHKPFDPIWQLLREPVSNKDFMNGNIHVKDDGGATEKINRDISDFLSLAELDQLTVSEKRIKNEGAANELIRNEVARTQMDIEVIYQDRDTELYNAATNDFNKAKKLFNQYVEYRNRAFLPSRPVDEIRAMLITPAGILKNCTSKLKEIKLSKARLALDHSYLESEIQKLHKKISDQNEFISAHFLPKSGTTKNK